MSLQKLIQPLTQILFSKIPEVELLRLQTRILCDYRTKKVDAVYVYAQTFDNQDSGLKTATALVKKGLANCVAIAEGETEHGAAGFTYCTETLCNLGLLMTNICQILPYNTAVNTLSEAKILVKYAKKHGWKSIYISTTPFHQLRAFITTISVVIKEYPELKVYSAVGDTQDWSKDVLHSQGEVGGTRENLITMEYGAIARYTKKGDLLPIYRILDYLQQRDKEV